MRSSGSPTTGHQRRTRDTKYIFTDLVLVSCRLQLLNANPRPDDFNAACLSIALRRDKVDSFDRYPFSLPAIRSLDRIELHPKVTFFIGENGSGKSTLLEALAVSLGFNPEGRSKNFRFGTRSSHSVLHDYLRVAKGFRGPRDGYFLRAKSFFNVATEIESLDAEPAGGPPVIHRYGGRSLHEQSHSESFLALIKNRFGSQGLYILDEPEAALSPRRLFDILLPVFFILAFDGFPPPFAPPPKIKPSQEQSVPALKQARKRKP